MVIYISLLCFTSYLKNEKQKQKTNKKKATTENDRLKPVSQIGVQAKISYYFIFLSLLKIGSVRLVDQQINLV